MPANDDELRRALHLLEGAIARHEDRLEDMAPAAESPIHAEVRRTLDLMRQEAARLRIQLGSS